MSEKKIFCPLCEQVHEKSYLELVKIERVDENIEYHQHDRVYIYCNFGDIGKEFTAP